MSVINDISAGQTIAKKLLEWIPLVAVGFLLCLVTCGKGSHTRTSFSGGRDTLVIDTSKIIYRNVASTPEIIVQRVDSSHDCWGSIAPVAFGGDTLSIDSANSCKGIYRGVRIGHSPDTLRDTVRVAMSDERLAISNAPTASRTFGVDFSIGAGPALGAFGVLDAEARVWSGHWMLELRPQVFYQDKIRAFISSTIRYRP